jgi:hypothetical protein
VELKRLQNQLAEMQLIAARRSGARGLKARQDVIAKEQEVLVARVKSQDAPTAEEIAAAHDKGTFFLDEIQQSLEAVSLPPTRRVCVSIPPSLVTDKTGRWMQAWQKPRLVQFSLV